MYGLGTELIEKESKNARSKYDRFARWIILLRLNRCFISDFRLAISAKDIL